MNWRSTTALLCIYGAIKEFRPATPFLTPFLTSDEKNLTLDEVYSQIYPYWTYSYMVALIPMFVLTDLLRHKPIILIEAVGLVITWLLLVFGSTVTEMQIMQITFGISSAAEIAYYSYVYSIVDTKHYKKATSYVRTSAMAGKLLAFGLGQVLISTGTADYLVLNQISLVAVSIVTVIAIFLPRVKSQKSQIATTNLDAGGADEIQPLQEAHKPSYATEYFAKTKTELRTLSKNKELLRWSMWWALASCGMYQVQNYIQSLWADIQTDPSHTANGIVEFTNTCCGALLSFFIQYASFDFLSRGQHVLAGTSLLICALLYVCAVTSSVLYAYISYIAISSIYHMLITAAAVNVAKEISSNNHGLVFGCNTFFAVCLQTLLTIAVVDSHFLHLDIRSQFIVYAGYFGVVALIFTAFSFFSAFETKREESQVDVEGVEGVEVQNQER